MTTNPHDSSARRGRALRFKVTVWIATFLVISGASAGTIQLSSPNPSSGGAFGSFWGSTMGLPDLNGDRIGELLVWASYEPVDIMTGRGLRTYANAGRAYVYDGATAELLYTIVSPALPTVVSWGGAELAGDVNDDGVEDLMIFVGGLNGALYFLDGQNGEVLFALHSPNPAGQNGGFGFAASKLADVDGDDRSDWVVGQGGWTTAGRVYVFSSATREVIWQAFATELGRMGFGCRGLPDLNGDGAGDVAVGYPQQGAVLDGQTIQEGGYVTILSGVDGEELYRLQAPQPQTGDRFGEVLACPGDVDGDGTADLAVGTHWGGPGEDGRVYLFSGADGDWLRTFASPIEYPEGRFGWAIEPLPDRTGDGVKELWILGCEESRGFIFDAATGTALETLESPIGGSFWPVSTTDNDGETLGSLVFAQQGSGDSGRVVLVSDRPFPPRIRIEHEAGDAVSLSYFGEMDRQYAVETSEDLQQWAEIDRLTLQDGTGELTIDSQSAACCLLRLRLVE